MLKLYENIKRLRIEARMTQDQLAKAAGYTDRSSISKIEKGEVDLPQSKIKQFAEIFGVPQGTLMGWVDEEEENAVNHQQTDFAANVLVKLGESEDFATAVKLLYNLDAKQLAGVVGMLRSFSE